MNPTTIKQWSIKDIETPDEDAAEVVGAVKGCNVYYVVRLPLRSGEAVTRDAE
tara:strand:+ start:437 stop:595 length:159 start_codon:yes stop_codon:yes gene_type:complete